jgi:hypothetical protein
MAMTNFTRDEDKDEINPMEKLRMIKKIDLSIFLESNYFYGESWRWHMSIHN